MKVKKRKIIKILIFLVIFIITLGVSYKMFSDDNYQKTKTNNKLKVVYDDENYITITDLKSTTNQVGLKKHPLHLSITNTGKDDILYKIKLIEDNITKIVKRENIKYNVYIKDKVNKTDLLNKINNNTIYEGTIKAGNKYKQDFYLRLWVNEGTKEDLKDYSYKAKIKVEALKVNSLDY